MNSFHALTDNQLLQIYSQSCDLNISPDFVLMLQKEIHTRNLLIKNTSSDSPDSALAMEPIEENFE